MTYRGHVNKGVVVLDEPVAIEEGAEVRVEVVEKEEGTGRSLAQRLAAVIGKARSLPEDAAENHDHYLYGVPKK
jgi:hypothetical protein